MKYFVNFRWGGGQRILVKCSNKKDKKTVWEQVVCVTNLELCSYVKSVIKDYYAEYMDTFEKYVQITEHFNCNMFVGKKIIIDKYCEWLFGILEKVEEVYYLEHEKIYENREMGYLGELLFRVWVEYNNVEYIVTDTINIEEHIYTVSQIGNLVKDICKRLIIRRK